MFGNCLASIIVAKWEGVFDPASDFQIEGYEGEVEKSGIDDIKSEVV